MTTFNTGNAVPSGDARDRFDNSQTLDEVVSGNQTHYRNRIGVYVMSLFGMKATFESDQANRKLEFDTLMLSMGYMDIGDYDSGPLSITSRNQVFKKDGELWKAGPSVTLPFSTSGNWAVDKVGMLAVGDNSLRQQIASGSGSGIIGYLRAKVGAVFRTAQSKFEEDVTPTDFGASPSGIADATTAFDALQAAYSGRIIDLKGGTFAVSAIPSGNTYVNGFFNLGGTIYNAAQDSTAIGSATDTGGLIPAYNGGTQGTPTLPGRDTVFNRVIIACSNCRVLFVRGAAIASIYTWVKANVGFAAAARQCVVNGPQASAISSEECQSYGFRAVHYGSVFCKAMVSSGGSFVSRLGRLGGSYVALVATNTCRIGNGRNARLIVTVTAGQVSGVAIADGGSGYNPETIILEFEDRSAGGSGATAKYTVDSTGKITSIYDIVGGSNYSENTEAMLTQPESTSAVIASELTNVHTGKNNGAMATAGCEVSGSQSAAIASDASKATAARASVISSIGSTASGLGSVVLGAVNSQSIAERAVALGRRVIADLPGSFVIGEALAGVAATINKVFQVTSNGNVTAKGTFTGNTIYVDYAEFFENLVSGVAIGLGIIVTLRGGKVCPAQENDYILGVVSGTALIRAGDSPLYWAKRHLTGKFGEPLMVDVPVVSWDGVAPYDGPLSAATAGGVKIPGGAKRSLKKVPVEAALSGKVSMAQVEWVSWKGYEGFDGSVAYCKKLGLKVPTGAVYSTAKEHVENPDFDPSIPNTPRSDRPEDWSCVGVTGQVHVRVSTDDVEAFTGPGVSGYVKVIDGIGYPSEKETRLRFMVVTSPFNADDGFAVAKCFIR